MAGWRAGGAAAGAGRSAAWLLVAPMAGWLVVGAIWGIGLEKMRSLAVLHASATENYH
jgi:hypothetical protein